MRIRILCLLMISLTTLSCRREDSQPELKDPIYIDLTNELRAMEGIHSDTEKSIEKATKELEKSQPRTIDRKNAEGDVYKYTEKLRRVNEMIEFYKIRAERRRAEGRRAYKLAFREGRAWPDPAEFETYMTNKRLIHASRNWSDRVPRSSRDIKQNPASNGKKGAEISDTGTEINSGEEINVKEGSNSASH